MQIEAHLNSRPLVPFSCDNDGADAMTPGHFLIGRPLGSLPDPGSPISFYLPLPSLTLVPKFGSTLLAAMVL